MRRTIEIAAFFVALLIVTLTVYAWLASRADQRQLKSTLADQKRLLDAAGARERSRDATLANALAQIEALKRATQTPAQIVRDLPKYLPLPQPITLPPPGPPADAVSQQGTSPSPKSAPTTSTTPVAPFPSESTARPSPTVTAQLPTADLKPLYDYVQDCRSCQAQLATAKQDSAADASKITALTRERDAAITAAKGGTFLRRLRRNAVWFAMGAAAAYAAARR
jgi:hypothetical protein